MTASEKPNEICFTRVYDAPVQAVWDAWTDPAQVALWWGPRGFTITTHSKDLRPGGHWKYTMHGPDGVDYPNHTLYYEVEECQKLVYDHGGSDDRPPLFRVTVLFSESEGKTTMDMTMAFATAEQASASKKFIKEANGYSTWDRLAEYLDETKHCITSFVIARSFPAPIERLFDMWVEPEHLSKWMPPTGFDMKVLSGNIQEGGTCFFQMSNHAGVTLYGKLDYQELEKPQRIVYIQRFCDEQGNLSRHPGLPVFPEALLATVNFTPEDDQTTLVTVSFEPFGAPTTQEIQVFKETRPSMTQGWTSSFDSLETLVTDAAGVT